MKIQVLTICTIFFGIVVLHAQVKEAPSSDDNNNLTLSPLMMFHGDGKALHEDKEEGKHENKALSSEEEGARNRTADSEMVGVDLGNQGLENDGLGDKSEKDHEKGSAGSEVDQQQPNLFSETAPALTTPETILSRRYLRLDPLEFEIIAGCSERNNSWASRQLREALEKYKGLQSNEAKKEKLLNLKSLAKGYLDINEDDLVEETEKSSLSIANAEHINRNIDACALLLRGIDVEQACLKKVISDPLENGSNSIPHEGVHIRSEDKLIYQSNFALERMMHVATGLKNTFHDKENLLVELTKQQKERLGFDPGSTITKKQANFWGRSFAAYKLNELLGSHLVPRIDIVDVDDDSGSKRRSYFQQNVRGKQLYEEAWNQVSQEELENFLRDKKDIKHLMVEVAIGKALPDTRWKLCFPDFLQQVSVEKPLLENNQPITEQRAMELAQEGAFYFKKKRLVSVDREIDFESPSVQQTKANAQLFQCLTGEVHPDPLDFTYFKDADDEWRVCITNTDFSFPSDVALQKTGQEKGEEHALVLPALIDAKMGEAILGLSSKKLEEMLRVTRLTKAESGAISRLSIIQEHILKIKNEGRLVHSWDAKTYQSLLKDQNKNYLLNAIAVRKTKTQKLQAVLSRQLDYLTNLQSPSVAEAEKVIKVRRQLETMGDFNSGIHTQVEVEANPDDGTFDLVSAEGLPESPVKNSLEIFFTKLVEGAERVGSYLTHTKNRGTNSIKRVSRLLRQPDPNQALLLKSNIACLHANQKTLLRGGILQRAQEKTCSGDRLDEVHECWQKVIHALLEEQHAWKIAVSSYEAERDHGQQPFFRTPRENAFYQGKNKQLDVADHLLWARMHEAECVVGIAWKRLQSAAEPAKQLLWKRALDQLARAQQAWIPIFSRVSMISSDPLPREWDSYFQVTKNQNDRTPFYSSSMDACFKAYLANKAFQKNFFEDASDCGSDVIKIWENLMAKLPLLTKSIPEDCEAEWEKQMKEVEYQKNQAVVNRLWALVRKEEQAITLRSGQINDITNVSKTMGTSEELNQLVNFLMHLEHSTQLSKKLCAHLVVEAEKQRDLDLMRFNSSIYQDPNVGIAYCRFQLSKARALPTIDRSILQFDGAGSPEEKKSFFDNAIAKLSNAKKVWSDVVTSYQKYHPLQNWKPHFYFDAGVSADVGGSAPIDIRAIFSDALNRPNLGEASRKILGAVLSEEHPEKDQWNLEMEEAISERALIGFFLEEALRLSVQK